MMGTKSSYFIAVISSIGIHAIVILAVLANWESETKRTVVQPQYIQAELIQLAPKKTAVTKPAAKPKLIGLLSSVKLISVRQRKRN